LPAIKSLTSITKVGVVLAILKTRRSRIRVYPLRKLKEGPPSWRRREKVAMKMTSPIPEFRWEVGMREELLSRTPKQEQYLSKVHHLKKEGARAPKMKRLDKGKRASEAKWNT
jgi:hypothetical protein